MTSAHRGPLDAATRVRKLRAMSLHELWTRVRYDAYCRVERTRHQRGALAAPDRLRAALTPDLSGTSRWREALCQARQDRTRRFFRGAEERATTRALMHERFGAERSQAREHAERAQRHEFTFFGGTHRYGRKVAWHADPVSRALWPRVYHRQVPVHGGDVGFGDVKHVWELGRHQFLIDLAKAWALERDGRAAAAMRELVFDWRDENPVATGVGWSCSLEPAFRVLSWLWAYFLTLDDPQFDDDGHVRWLEGFFDHGWFLYRHLEYYTSPFNHLAGEACALYCLGVLFPEFRESTAWRAHARHVLESRLAAQFYSDGGSVEQSTFYHHATTGFYLTAAVLGRVNGEEFSPAVWAAIERAIEFSMALQQPDGTTPRIGGADDGKPVRLEQLPLWDFRPYQAMGAVLFGRPDFKAAAGRFYEDAAWLFGAEGALHFDALPSTPPARRSRALPASGYVVIRSSHGEHGDYLCFDCGEQAAGLRRDGIASAAHGHADCLSVIVWRGGRPVLVDPGFYCYNGPKPWQDHFRETAAHSTVRVDGRDQAVHINKMAWSHTYTARLEGHDLDGADPWAIASHDGFRELPNGAVIHRRAIWVRRRGYIVICDCLEGTGTHDVEVVFQFAPGRLEVGSSGAAFEDRVELAWFATAPLTARLHHGESAPDGGWIAPSLGVKAPAPRLVLAATTPAPARVITIVADATAEPIITSCESASGGAIRVEGRGWADWLFANGFGKDASSRFRSDALLAAWREENGGLVPDGRAGGTFQDLAS